MSPRTRGHWRSLEQLADDPRAREFLEREFPEGASEPPEGVTRRTMLTLLGASLSMAGLAGCRRPVEEIVPYVNAPEQVIPGIPRYFATTMPFGLDAFGLVVESHEGRPTKIEGNEHHSSSGGATSAILQASILGLYDPDRAQNVMHEGETKRWDDFVAAWGVLEQQLLDEAGGGLAVVSEPFSSPTLTRLREQFLERFPFARWVAYDAVGDENAHAGIRSATGASYLPVHHLDRARVIVSLDSDFLLTECDPVRHARGFAAGRRVSGRTGSMNRLYVAEGMHTLTGANADHRLRLPSGRIAGLTVAIAAALKERGVAVDVNGTAPSAVDTAWIDAVANDLAAHRGECLVVAGRRQPAEVHAAVVAINAALGNIGTTVTYREPVDAVLPEAGAMSALVSEMNAGEVSTLVVLGGNPSYDTPADLEFSAALGQVGRVIRVGLHSDETATDAAWLVPLSHFLESWGDARSSDGTLSVIQPLIQPLFGTKSDVEVLGLLATGEDRTGYDIVRETWQSRLDGGGFEQEWRRVLHDGVLKDSVVPAVTPRVNTTVNGLRDTVGADLELNFAPAPAVHDGRFANNGWLQELPDAITKLAWDNAALFSPATAERLGLQNEDVVRVNYEGRELEAPVWIVPGQADETVVLTLGYGRESAGRVGNGAGFNAYTLRTAASPWFGGGAAISKTGDTQMLAQTQDHGSMEGRPLVREATVDQFHEHPEFAAEMVEVPNPPPLYGPFDYSQGNQWGMTIDLNSCTGCNACVIACQSENNVPVVGRDQVRRGREMHWLRLDRYFNGEVDDPQVVFQAVPCMHCENAPCEQVCPVAATVHDEEGLNAMTYNRCIGTRYCSNNCPYKVRRFNFYNFTTETPEIMQLAMNPDVTVRTRGVMEKCSYCTQRIQAAKIQARLDDRELTDGEVRTACQQACPAGAIQFGNVIDEGSAVARTKAEPRNYAILAELNTRPRTTYLAKLRNPNEEVEES